MTSSLVGSEMCIRDRSMLWNETQPTYVPPVDDYCAAQLEVQCQESGPVSYTHLTLPTICSV
eukprot:9682797-Prorocentrum_lima.AAC.1